MRYAQKEKKNILNLAEEGYGDKEWDCRINNFSC